jgi:hypothetical protein
VQLTTLIETLSLEVLTPYPEEVEVTAGYCGDLLSHVLASARPGAVWVTIQHHANVVAVAQVAGLSAVVMAEGKRPDDAAVSRARSSGVVLLGSNDTAFNLCGRLYALLADSR